MDGRNGTIEFVRLSASSGSDTELADDVRAGLTAKPKVLSPKYFYDARGSRLFEEITRLPEYYLTRAETAILERVADDVFAAARPDELVEIGAGSSLKTVLLTDALGRAGGERYVAIDVSEDALRDAADRLVTGRSWLEFLAVVGDFNRDLARIPRHGARLVAFLGSTIGNLERTERVHFLRVVRSMLAEGDCFLLGVDLVKPAERLIAAYNDAAGVTAEFNRNVLHVLNRELDGDLPLDAFDHRAIWEPVFERMEMHLIANRPVRARLAALDLTVEFAAGESVRTEISCKFTREAVEEALAAARLELQRWIPDEHGDFALALARPV